MLSTPVIMAPALVLTQKRVEMFLPALDYE